MADPVAIVSVVSSGVIALGTLGINYRTGREQRRHEATQGFEQRAWETKSKALYEVIAVASQVVKAAKEVEYEVVDPGKKSWDLTIRFDETKVPALGQAILRATEVIAVNQGIVQAFASDACRKAFDEFEEELDGRVTDKDSQHRIRMARLMKEQAIDRGDFEAAARQRDAERTAIQNLTVVTLGLDSMVEAGERLVTEARKSVRSSVD